MDESITVKKLLERIKFNIEPLFSKVSIVGEVSNFRGYGKHWYFTLKEDGASVQCAIWFSQRQRINFTPKDGCRVHIKGSLNIYTVNGTMTLSVTSCVLAGVGSLQSMLRHREAELRADGLFDKRKRMLPRFPRRIAVIAAIGGAALWDVITVTGRRAPGIDLLICHAAAQGIDAVRENVAALKEVQKIQWGCDLVLIVRGGGSLEDLWSYNDSDLVRNIANCRIPIITGIGHEIDVSLSDLAADVRAATPSQAAELATPDIYDLVNKLKIIQNSLINCIVWNLNSKESNLNMLVDSKGMHFVLERLKRDNIVLSSMHQYFLRYIPTLKFISILSRVLNKLWIMHPQKIVDRKSKKLELLSQRLVHVADFLGYNILLDRLANYFDNISNVIISKLVDFKYRLTILITQLKAMNPYSPMERGFILAFDSNGCNISRFKYTSNITIVDLQWIDGGCLAILRK